MNNTSGPRADANERVRRDRRRPTLEDFLGQLRPSGHWVLTAIIPDGPTKTITADSGRDARRFVEMHDGERNLYFSVNPTRTAMSSKAAKVDIAAIEYLLADLDPREDESPKEAKARYRENLRNGPTPTVIIDSGNGIQALWRLSEPIVLPEPITNERGQRSLSPEAITNIADIEERTKALIERLGGVAGTQNIDRILRLPGTTNLPNAKKRKAGRVSCPTQLIQFNGAAYDLDAFPRPAAHDNKAYRKSGGNSLRIDEHTDAATIIRALDGNLQTGMCHCPAHDDKTPSFKVSDGHDGKVLVHCFAGCTQQAVIDALRARNLWHKKSPKRDAAERQKHDGYTLEETHRILYAHTILRTALDAELPQPTDYLRGRGIKLVPECAMVLPPEESAQYTGHHFPAMVCPVRTDRGIIGAHVTFLTKDTKEKLALPDGNPRRLYGKTKGGYIICGVSEPDKALVVGEGIETTLAAMQISGLPGIAALSATNMPMVRPPKCSEVIIAADNDPPGLRAAAQLAERLEYEGRRVVIARPPVEGADWNDRLIEGEKAAREEWRAALETGDVERDSAPVSALQEDDFMALAFPERQLRLRPWLPSAGLVMIHAARGEGKTWFALSVGKAVASGQDFLGWSCPDQARVLYVDGELPGAALQGRLDQFRSSPPGMFHVLCRDTFHLRRQLMPDLGEPEGRKELDRVINRCQPDLIIFDSISTLVRSGVENEAESWTPMQDWLLKHRWQGRTIILVHHDGRSGRPRGTSKREDVLDTMIHLHKVIDDRASETDDSIFQLTFTKARDFYGHDAEPLRLRLSTVDGQVSWTHDTVSNVREDQIGKMLNDGVRQVDIAKELGLTKGRVNQIVQKMKKRDGDVVKFPPKRGGRKV
jgi:putative DNA primase/helicase